MSAALTLLLATALASSPTPEPPDATPAPTAPPPPTPTPVAAPPRGAALDLAARPGEPTVQELRAAATRLAAADPDRARSMIARAGRSAWLPEIRLRIERRFGRNESLDHGLASPLPPPIELDTVNDVRYEWRATWDLARLVFNPEELQAQTEALRMGDVRMEVESLVIRLYFERKRLRVEGALGLAAPDPAASARRELRIQEIEAELDALSGGLMERTRGGSVGAVPPLP